MTFMSHVETDQFAHIRRMRDSRFPHEIASILPGEFFVSATPMVIYTVLGSCISACIRDPIVRVGGMNHFMLPEPKEAEHDSWGESTRYGSFAMESLINAILKRGGIKNRLEIKLFGAGKIYDSQIDVGDKNAKWVIQYLESEGLSVMSPDMLSRHFLRGRGDSMGRFKVKPHLASMIRFRRLNLMDDDFPIRNPLDLIFCRNVMIYFDRPTQETLVNKFHRYLKPGGYLFIGHSESLQWVSHPFMSLAPTIYQKER